jgi:hypothetical protein
MSDADTLLKDVLKSFSVSWPSAGTNVHTSLGPAREAPNATTTSDRVANFFFRASPVRTPGSGNLMRGTPKVLRKKGRSA